MVYGSIIRLTGEELALNTISMLKSDGKYDEAKHLEMVYLSGAPYISLGYDDIGWEILRYLEKQCDGCVISNSVGGNVRFWFNDVYYV